MAFTKAPTTDNHNVQSYVPRISPFLATNSYTNGLPTLSPGYINCFPMKEAMWGAEPRQRIHKRAGWDSVVASGTGLPAWSYASGAMVQPVFVNFPRVLYAVDDHIYMLNYNTNANSVIAGTSGTLYGRGYGTNAIDSSNTRQMAFLEAYNITTYLTLISEGSLTVTSNTNIGGLLIDGEKGIVFIDGYLFAVDSGGSKIYNSAAGGNLTTWNATDFIDAEQYADDIKWIDKHHNYLVAFGNTSIEFFYDAGIEIGSPLARQESYSCAVGLYATNNGTLDGGVQVARIDDDLYFLGKGDTVQPGLYRLSNFKVERLESQWIEGILAAPGSNQAFVKLNTITINNNPMIQLTFAGGDTYIYFPLENVWWKASGSDFPTKTGSGVTLIGTPFVTLNTNADTYVTVPKVIALTADLIGGSVAVNSPDVSNTVSVTASFVTEPIDFGINFTKNFARIDAVGDFYSNALTLSYNRDGTYTNNFVSTYAITPSTIGLQNNISWYNLGPARNLILKFEMVGAYGGILDRFDIEYNIMVS